MNIYFAVLDHTSFCKKTNISFFIRQETCDYSSNPFHPFHRSFSFNFLRVVEHTYVFKDASDALLECM